MLNQPFYQSELNDWNSLIDDDIELSPTAVELSPEQVDRAVELSEPIINSKRRWQTYLNALALLGFEQWLKERAPDLVIGHSNCSIYYPEYANLFEGVAQLDAGEFQLGLIVSGSIGDTVVSVSRALIDLPQFVPHFYVLVEVLEEQMQVRVCGYLRHDQLVNRQQSDAASIDSDWTSLLPLEWFIPSSNALLLELDYIKAENIPLPISPPMELLPSAELRSKLADVHTQLYSTKWLAEDVLTWREGATLLMHPEIVSELYQQSIHQDQPLVVSQPNLVQNIINVGCWLQGQLDAIAQDLSWVLMPPFVFGSASMRTVSASSVSSFDNVASELDSKGFVIPAGARGAYQDLNQADSTLRLYVVTWMMPFTQQEPEWTLLLTLGTPIGTRIPMGTRLRVRDATQQLTESIATDAHQDSYLCIQVAGSWAEQFWVTVEFDNGEELALPPFAFNPDQV